MRFILILILTLIIGLYCTTTANAKCVKCSSSGIWAFPSGHSIKENPIFVLTGYESSQVVILELNKKHNVYLQSGGKKIKLLVTDTYIGLFRLTQAILKPETVLEAGQEYTLYIDGLDQNEALNRFNPVTKELEPIRYKVIAGTDMQKPDLTTRPSELTKTLVYYGCGPAKYVVFSCPVKDASEIIVKTIVRNINTGKETMFYIEPEKGKIKIGHGMCSGAFDFKDSDDYEVEFSFADASGNLTAWTGERIKFTKPMKETGSEDE
jgi:hypothetical protein